MPAPKPPEAKDIHDLHAHLSGVWSKAHARWKKTDEWYWGTVDIWDGKNRPQIVPGRASAIIDHAADTHLPWSPKVHRNPIGDTDDAQEEADELEEALRQVMLDAMLHNSQMAFKQANRHFGAYGYAVIEGPVLNMRQKPQKPKKSDYPNERDFKLAEIDYKNSLRQWNPVEILAPHPSRVLMDPWEANPREAIFRKQFTHKKLKEVLDAKRKNGRNVMDEESFNKVFRESPTPYARIRVLEYWSEWYHAMQVHGTADGAGQLLFIERNTWGFNPFNHRFAGFGQERTDDETNDPRYLARGLLDPLIPEKGQGTLQAQAQNVSAKHNGIIERGFPRRGARDLETNKDQLQDPDAVLEGEKEDFWTEDQAEMPRWMFEQGRELEEDISLSTFVMDLAGSRQQGVNTVGQQAILSEAAGKKFQALGHQINQMGTVIGRNILKLVRRLEEDISAGGHTLKWKAIKDDYSVVVSFETVDVALNIALRELGLRENQQELISDETYREEYRRDNNESEERRRLIKQRVRSHPAVIELMARGVMEEEGLLRLVEQLEQEEGEQASGLVGPNGQPVASGQSREMLTSQTQRPPQPNLPVEGA